MQRRAQQRRRYPALQRSGGTWRRLAASGI